MDSRAGPRFTQRVCHLTLGDNQHDIGFVCRDRYFRTFPLRHASQRLTLSIRNLYSLAWLNSFREMTTNPNLTFQGETP